MTNDGFPLEHLTATDPELTPIIRAEIARQENELQMIASENVCSRAVLEAMATPLTNKYAEGYPGKRYYGGCEVIDRVESLAIERLKRLFGAAHANVQPHSGAAANQAVMLAAIAPGDTILGLSLAHGGHLTHGAGVNYSGRFYVAKSYGVAAETGLIDYDELERAAKEFRPKLIVSGASAYPRRIDFARISAIAREVGARHLSDIAHYAGLVAAGLYPSPVGEADYVTSTTHKTLRGPRGGIIMAAAEQAAAVDKAVFPGLQGGPLEHIIAAKAVCFHEAASEAFRRYQQAVMANAAALAKHLLERGLSLVSGGTDCHLILVDLRDREVTGKDAELALGRIGITANKNAVPGDPRKPAVTSGLRLGSPALTTRGLGVAEMLVIADLIADVIEAPADAARCAAARRRVAELCAAFPLYRAG